MSEFQKENNRCASLWMCNLDFYHGKHVVLTDLGWLMVVIQPSTFGYQKHLKPKSNKLTLKVLNF